MVDRESRRVVPRCRITSKKRFSLPELGLAGEPGKQVLSEQQVAVARDGQKLGDALNESENECFQPCHQVRLGSKKSVKARRVIRLDSSVAAEAGQCDPNIAQAAVNREDHGEPGEAVARPPEDRRF